MAKKIKESDEINKSDDTIVAIATGMGNSGIGIIRVSGNNSIKIIDKIFIPKNKNKNFKSIKGYQGIYGNIYYENEYIDEVVCIVMKAPNTYTKEDIVEIDCHGNIIILRKITEIIISQGARIAEPGEFTKRAFLNGRIDLSQAESVMDLLNSKNEMAVKSSMSNLRGNLKNKVTQIREKIIYNIAYIESALDDPENYSLDGYINRLKNDVDNMLITIDDIIKNSENGRLFKEGITTTIIGSPNAGKSSLLNMLLGENRAIVTDIEGTTRDTLEETINVDGILLNIIDTAGIRETFDTVEKIGIEKAIESVKRSDLVLFIIDGSREISYNEKIIIEHIKDKKVITIINKNDLKTVVDKMWITSKISGKVIEISAIFEDGKKDLIGVIKDMFFAGKIEYNDELYLSNLRQKKDFVSAKKSLLQVLEGIDSNMSEDFLTIDLLDAYRNLGKIIGEEVEDDIVNKIFKEFCTGK